MNTYEVLIRLAIAIAVGGLIGYERSYNNRPAGFRTHILVCVGAAVVSMIQIETIEQTKNMILENPVLANSLKADIGRMGAQVITGVGFLGAGTIIREKGLVKGLTTAASVWVVACIGLAIGLGMYYISIVSTIGVFVSLFILKKFERRFLDRAKNIEFEIEYADDSDFIKNMQKYFKSKNIKVNNIKFIDKKQKNDSLENEDVKKKAIYSVEAHRHMKDSKILQDLCKRDGIIKIKIV